MPWLNEQTKRLLDWALKTSPIAGLIAVASYFAAKQAITPHRRVIKIAVLLWLLVLMLRFDMVYSIYLFVLLYPFPSGIALGSTNAILMTIIPVVWLVRASSTKERLLTKTPVDAAIILFIGAFIISFFNVDTQQLVVKGLKVMWIQVTAIVFFYLTIRFVDTEEKLQNWVLG